MTTPKKKATKKPAGTKRASKQTSSKNSENQDGATNKNTLIDYKLNWERCLFVDKRIDDNLVRELTPQILRFKETSKEPITVAIDSMGGSISSLSTIIGLLKAPDQDGNEIPIYTVATNRAFSAAANMLAFGDYSVAFPHSQILYHDLRFGSIEDVTPTLALEKARTLQRDNDAFALRLAHTLIGRLIWVYIDTAPRFGEIRKKYSAIIEKYEKSLSQVLVTDSEQKFDLLAFVFSIFDKISRPNDFDIVLKALNKLEQWIQIEQIERKINETDKDGLGPLVSLNTFVESLTKTTDGDEEHGILPDEAKQAFLDEKNQKSFNLLHEVIIRRFSVEKDWQFTESCLDTIADDFRFISSIRDSKHTGAIVDLMIKKDYIFMKPETIENLKKAKEKDERNEILLPVFLQARILWYFIVLMSQNLCTGDHLLTPYDAQLLGIVDEVLGGGPVQSRREWDKTKDKDGA